MTRSTASESGSAQSELLVETQRTTHAVRAIARFLILEVTYGVAGALLIALGVISLTVSGGGTFAGVLILGGGGTIVAGLIHSLQAGWDELSKSNRLAITTVPSANRAGEQEPQSNVPFQVLEGTCKCSKWERGSRNTVKHDGIEYCGRCSKGLKT
jgi:hypothetical protein